jgi:hypothetical protein
MSYLELSGHWVTYAAVLAGIAYIVALTAVFLRKAWRRALEIGYSRQQLLRIVKVSVTHAAVPAVAVLVGFLALAPMLGIPLSWWRLSIVGNTTYEIMAAQAALNSIGVVSGAEDSSGRGFVLVVYVIAVGIMGAMVMSLFLSRKVHKGVFKSRLTDRRWSALNVNAYMMTIAIVFVVPILFKFTAALLTLLSGAALSFAMKFAVKKLRIRWLDEFSFTIAMLAAMASSVFWSGLFG